MMTDKLFQVKVSDSVFLLMLNALKFSFQQMHLETALKMELGARWQTMISALM